MVVKGNKLLPLVLFRVKSSLQSGCQTLGQAMLCYEFESLHDAETQPKTEKGISIFPSPVRPNLRWETGCVCGRLGSVSPPTC